jgi:hypothetical protein
VAANTQTCKGRFRHIACFNRPQLVNKAVSISACGFPAGSPHLPSEFRRNTRILPLGEAVSLIADSRCHWNPYMDFGLRYRALWHEVRSRQSILAVGRLGAQNQTPVEKFGGSIRRIYPLDGRCNRRSSMIYLHTVQSFGIERKHPFPIALHAYHDPAA